MGLIYPGTRLDAPSRVQFCPATLTATSTRFDAYWVKMRAMDIWTQRVVREWIDNKWGGVPAFLWDVKTVISVGLAGAALGWLWAMGTDAWPDALLVVLWGATGLVAGWLYVLIRRPS